MNIDYVLLAHGINVASNLAAPPDPITNLKIEVSDSKLTLKWENPISLSFQGVRIQRKTGSYPISPTDGTTIFNGVAVTCVDTNLTNDVEYFYRAFVYDKNNNFNTHISQQVSAKPRSIKIYTIIIDTANSNPSTSVTYADDAVGMVAGSSAWDSIFPFNEIRPVVFKNGQVNYYLNPNDFSKKLDGTEADITSGNDGDVMIEFPKVWTYIRKVSTKLHVSLATYKVDSNYKCLGHTKKGIEKDYFYMGTYQGFISSNKLRSLSGKKPTDYTTLSDFRTAANLNGPSYRLMSYYQVLIIQVLYLIKYKNLDSQSTIGVGSTHRWDAYTETTGTTNQAGMTLISKSTNSQMKLFGIEDLWAGYGQFIDGIFSDPNNNILISDSDFNDEGSGYTNFGKFSSGMDIDGGCINNVLGGNETAFLPVQSTGSETTFFCDWATIKTTSIMKICLYGGMGEYYGGCGIFSVEISLSIDDGSWLYACASRLSYL